MLAFLHKNDLLVKNKMNSLKNKMEFEKKNKKNKNWKIIEIKKWHAR